MSKDLQRLIEAARTHIIGRSEKEQQRQSFDYGNTHIENHRITREVVAQQAERLKAAQSKTPR